MNRMSIVAAAALCLSACGDQAPDALGTLERDRITLPAQAAERIVAVDVREGQDIKAGQRVMQLEVDRTRSRLDALSARARQAGEAVAELEAGPRQEEIEQAQARVAAAVARAADAKAYYERVAPLGRRQLIAASDVDRAKAAAGNAEGELQAARAALLELRNGTRVEDLAQGRAAEAAAEAEAASEAVTLEKLSLVTPRDARVESLPYKLGDQVAVGTPLAILLVGDAPYARVYVPEPIRPDVHVGQKAWVRIEGRDARYEGRVRMIRSEPSFTPYYALTGEDAARLSYLAEITLAGEDAKDLPVGLPVQIDFIADAP